VLRLGAREPVHVRVLVPLESHPMRAEHRLHPAVRGMQRIWTHDDGDRWRAYLLSDDEVVVYCPHCEARVRRSNSSAAIWSQPSEPCSSRSVSTRVPKAAEAITSFSTTHNARKRAAPVGPEPGAAENSLSAPRQPRSTPQLQKDPAAHTQEGKPAASKLETSIAAGRQPTRYSGAMRPRATRTRAE
jgi:hypothetical protein